MPVDVSIIAPQSVILLGVVWIACLFDIRQQRIPNRLVGIAMLSGLTLQAITGAGIAASLLGATLGLAVLLPGYLLRVTGAGDVKLMAAIGVFLGPYWIIVTSLTTVLIGGIIALFYAISASLLRSGTTPWKRYGVMLRTLAATGRVHYVRPPVSEVMSRKFPFAIAIALGTTLTLLLWWPAVSAQWAG